MPPTPSPTRCTQLSVGFSPLCVSRDVAASKLLVRFQKAMQRSPWSGFSPTQIGSSLRGPRTYHAAPMTNAFPRRLIVMALELEGQGAFEQRGIPVLYCGVGKVNAAYALTRRLADYRHWGHAPPHVINFGTAGSRRHPTGTVVECHAFVQRDMDVSGLGVPLGTTPFDADVPARLEFPPLFSQLMPAICGTGDSFATAECALECDVLD